MCHYSVPVELRVSIVFYSVRSQPLLGWLHTAVLARRKARKRLTPPRSCYGIKYIGCLVLSKCLRTIIFSFTAVAAACLDKSTLEGSLRFRWIEWRRLYRRLLFTTADYFVVRVITPRAKLYSRVSKNQPVITSQEQTGSHDSRTSKKPKMPASRHHLLPANTRLCLSAAAAAVLLYEV